MNQQIDYDQGLINSDIAPASKLRMISLMNTAKIISNKTESEQEEKNKRKPKSSKGTGSSLLKKLSGTNIKNWVFLIKIDRS
jgi:hypothetical protein